MGAAILWRFAFIGKIVQKKKIPEISAKRSRNAIMLAIALIQAVSLTDSFEQQPLGHGIFSSHTTIRLMSIIMLTGGALIVSWLANLNQDKGLGGVTMFILYQVIINSMSTISDLHRMTDTSGISRIAPTVITLCIITAIIVILFGNAEIRLHVNKTNIDNGFSGVSYLPIKLNPAGASPIMYALTLMALPQFIVHAVSIVLPQTTSFFETFTSLWTLSTTVGFVSYLILLFILTIVFGILTVSPGDISKNMAKAGEYFDSVRPGRQTRKYILKHVLGVSLLSAVVLVILTGLPLRYVSSYPQLQSILLSPGTILIALGLLWLVQEEIADIQTEKSYTFSILQPAELTKTRSKKSGKHVRTGISSKEYAPSRTGVTK